MSEISSNSEEPILTKAELLKTRYNEYIALVEYARTNETTLSDDTRQNIGNRLEKFREALRERVSELLVDNLRSVDEVVTKESIASVLEKTEERIKKLSGATQGVYREVRDNVRDIYARYLAQSEVITTESLNELQELSDDKIVHYIDLLTQQPPHESVEELKATLDNTLDHVKELKRKNQQLEEQINNLLKEDEERSKELADQTFLGKQLVTLRATNFDLNKQLETSLTNTETLKAEVQGLSATIKTRDRDIAQAKANCTKLESKLNNLQDDFVKCRNEHSASELRWKETEAKLNSENFDLFEENQKLAKDLLEEKLKVENQERQLRKLQDDLAVTELEAVKGAEKLIGLEKRIVTLVEGDASGAESLSAEIHAELVKTFANQKQSLENEVDRLSKELKSSEKVINNYETAAENQKRELARQKELFHNEFFVNLRIANQSKAEIRQLNEQIVRLQEQLHDQESDDSDSENMASVELTKKLGELFSREDKKLISIYRGPSDDKEDSDILEWFKEAERVGNNNDWDDAQRLRFFSDRLKSEAMDWHIEYITNLKAEGKTPSYKEWKEDMIIRFRDESDIERLRSQLRDLRQLPDQRVRSFVAKINSLYDLANGKTVKVPTNLNSNTAEGRKMIELYDSNKKLRDEDKKKILMKGLLPKIKEDIWARLPKTPTYDDACEAAYTAESVVINKELGEDKSINAVLAGITLHDAVIANQSNEIVQLKERVNNLQTVASDRMEPNLVAAVQTWEPRSSTEQSFVPVGRERYNNWTPSQRQGSSGAPYARSRSVENVSSSTHNNWNNNRSRDNSRQRDNSQVFYNNNHQTPFRSNSPAPFRANSPAPPYTNRRPVQGRDGRGKGNTQGSSRSVSKICYNCGKRGHLASQCWAEPQPREVQRQRAQQIQEAAQRRRERRTSRNIQN